jgi:chromosome segregation ATPase
VTADIKFQCAHCGQSILVEAVAAGLATKCPTCRKGLTIPVLAAMNERQYDVVPRGVKREKARNGSDAGSRLTGSDEYFRSAESDVPGEKAMESTSQNGRADGEALEHRTEVARLREQLAASHSECERLKANTTHAQAELKSFQTDRLTLRNDLQLQRQRLAATETQLGARERDLSEKAAAVEQLTGERIALETQLAGVRSELAAMELEFKAKTAALSKARSEVRRDHAVLKEVRAELSTATAEAKSLAEERDSLRGETEALRRLLNETETGRELATARDRLAAADSERQHLQQTVAALEADLATSRAAVERLETLAAAMRRRMDEALAHAEAMSEDRINQDNEILRGIVARQNAELEVRHREIVRLKRARLLLRIAYALFGLGLLALAYMAMQILPGLPFKF